MTKAVKGALIQGLFADQSENIIEITQLQLG